MLSLLAPCIDTEFQHLISRVSQTLKLVQGDDILSMNNIEKELSEWFSIIPPTFIIRNSLNGLPIHIVHVVR